MLYPILVALLIAAIAVSGVVLVQAFVANARAHEAVALEKIVALAKSTGGTVTPLLVAEHLTITALEADRLLRSMVDDEHLTMAVSDQEGVLEYTFPNLTSVRRAHSSLARS